MNIDSKFVVRMVIESLLIVFSVLLALFLDQAWSERAERAATREQLASIRTELGANREIVAEWLDRHAVIAENLATLRAGEHPEPLIVDGRLRLDRLFGRSLAETMVRDTAWETAKTTGLVRNFDLRCANLLTDIYSLQQVAERQLWEIVGILGERAAHREEQLPQTLAILEFSIQELQGQERLLAGSYEQAQSKLDGDGCLR